MTRAARLRPEVATIAAVVVAVCAGVLIWKAIAGPPGGTTWTAEFTNARGLLTGNDVRVDGAAVGRITSISLSSRGTALVRFQLTERAASPRSDAVAAIEPADLLGDTFMSLSPGTARAPLHGEITAEHTVNAPRLDQVLGAFQPSVRDGLRVMLVEGGLALAGRGGDLGRATVALRPALEAAGSVLGELDSQNGSIAHLLGPAQRVAAQLDARRSDLGPLLDNLARTLGATAGASSELGQGLGGLPSTLRRLRATAVGLSAAATTATPLARQLGTSAGPLGQALVGLPTLVSRVRAAAPTLAAALLAARSAVLSGAPGLSRLSSAFSVLGAQAPTLSTLLAELDNAAPGIAQGFFVDFADQASESGRQPFDPFADPRRAYWRGAAVLSCEAFGVPVAPGCLGQAITHLLASPLAAVTKGPGRHATKGTTVTTAPAPSVAPAPPAAAQGASGPAGAGATATTPTTTTPAAAPPPPSSNTISQLLGFLFGK
jgi:virulence factor Mce-like protein